MRLLLRQGLRHHARHPLQTLLTLLGIAAGTALLCAMQLAQRSAEHAFDRALETVAGRATHSVTGGPDGLPVAGYAALRARLGGSGIAPRMHAVVRVPGRSERTVLRAIGIDPLAAAEVLPWAAPGGGGARLPVAELLGTAGGFVATGELLARLGIGPGTALPITVGGRPFTATCLGAIAPPPLVAAGLADVLLVDVATAQEWTGRLASIDRLDLFAPDGERAERALAAVRDVFGAGVRVERTGASTAGLAHLARGFRTNLTALSLLSLLVGAFLVHETMRLSVVARRAQFGVLRALGARGRELGLAVATESAALGALGSAVGAVAGVFAAQRLLAPLVRSLNDHYATFSLATLDVDPLTLAATVLLGTAVAIAAGLGPARAASRVSPREVLVPARTAGGSRRVVPLRWALPPLALGALLLATVGTRVAQAHLGLAAVLVAAVIAVPHGLAGLVALFARGVARAGPFVRYVARSTAAAQHHLALPVAAMVLAVATTIGIATLVASFRDSVAGWLGQVLPGDVYATVPGGVDERATAIDPAIVAALRGAPEVAATSTYRRVVARVEGGAGAGEIDVVGVDPTPRLLANWPLLTGDDANARAALLAGRGAWISEPLAFRWGLAIGDVLTFATGAGPHTLPVVATYRDYSKERGEILVGDAWCREHFAAGITALGFELHPVADARNAAVELARRAAGAAEQAVQVQATGAIHSASLLVFDRTFAITGVMRLLCLAVAFVGIYAAFAALQLERGREIGVLRALGARPLWIGFVVAGQTALLGIATGLMALPLGIALGHLLAHVVNRVSFGWTLVVIDVPPRAAGEALLLALVAALLAGVQPALRFARMRPVEVLREA